MEKLHLTAYLAKLLPFCVAGFLKPALIKKREDVSYLGDNFPPIKFPYQRS